MRKDQVKAAKLTVDVSFLIVLSCLPFLKVVTKFGYLDLWLFSFQIRDSTQDLGFSIHRQGEDCPDLMFLSGCDFFHRFETGAIVFGGFSLLTLVFLVMSLISSIEKIFTFPCAINSSIFNYLYPLSYLLGILVLTFYSKLFEDDLSRVQGKFNIIYHQGFYLLLTNIILCLFSVYLDSHLKPKVSIVEIPLIPPN
jgi:hypothetical protein